ncbi:MAG: aldehyde ferredoxin oxidoreductase family protein [Candidatus Bathyarchaeia archaeon]
MQTIKGYMGRILEVNLADKTLKPISLNQQWLRLYVGGSGYAVRILYNYLDKDTDPLSPENPLIFMAGPLTGVAAISPKTAAVSRSPLTGFLGKTMASGSFGPALKKAGYDGILIIGRSSAPVYLSIVDGTPSFHDASSLWGMGVLETCSRIRSELSEPKARIAVIGPAGEKLSKISAIVTDERRLFGRTGLGAVMGSKLLKAVAVRGNARPELADEKTLLELNSRHLSNALTSPRGSGLRASGTAGGIINFGLVGNLPIKNWTKGVWEGTSKIASQTWLEKYKLDSGMKVCGEEVMCSIQCERKIRVSTPHGEVAGKGPEYETLAALGSMTLVDDFEALTKANDLCDDLGLDTISTGTTIAWAMEAYEKGILTSSDVGFPLRWGDSKALIELIHMIGFRDGFGSIIADGVREAARKVGRGSDRFAIHCKGLEVAMHNPRLYHTMGLIYAFSNIGASHLQGMGMLFERGIKLPEYGINDIPREISEKVRTAIIGQNLCAFIDSVGLCKFGVFGVIDFNHIAAALNAVTGRQETKETILAAGDRIWHLERELNRKLGLKPEDDALPRRFIDEPVEDGPIKGATFPANILIPEFCKARGIDPETGNTDIDRLKGLELDV